MSLNKLTETSPIKNWMNIGANSIVTDSLSVAGLTYPTTTPPTTKVILAGSGGTLGYTVSPYAMLNFAVPYNLSPGVLTEVAGGTTSQVTGSSSVITYGNDCMYDFKITGALQGDQPIVNFYLVLGNILLNQITLTKTITPLTEDYVEISGSMHIMAGFPSSSNLSTCMKVSYSSNYLTGTAVPTAPVIVTKVKQMGGISFAPNSKLSIQMMSPSGTVIYSNYLSSFNCSYAPIV